ncbi:hypothetical protein [Longispora albida]|uniref:hypothetical protein n=1 Tax=Longispora albida TaxID=203523 RepID=UPI0003707693|nr:hypothetical protein [Longispora albida]
MNHPTESFAGPRGGADEVQQFRGQARQLPGPQQGAPDGDRSLGLRSELVQQRSDLAQQQASLGPGPARQAEPPPRELPPLIEPVYDPAVLEFSAEALADHPLLRGLLMELPPRGGQPPSVEWLDRWFEATRSILELLYSQGSYKMGA